MLLRPCSPLPPPSPKPPQPDWEPIARYLASRSQAAGGAEAGMAPGEAAQTRPAVGAGSQFDFFATIAPVWRGGTREGSLENSGFFPDTWVGGAWHSGTKPISARVTACVTCHTEPPQLDRLAVVEGVARFDFDRWLNWDESGPKLAVEAGRFIVPFGAIAGQSNPGALRTVTKPLMFNMGQNVNCDDIGFPVLPMPYSDEGFVVRAAAPVGGDFTATADFYVVNGLQGGPDGIDFFASRDYVDNNAEPAVGGRLAIANRWLTIGGSVMGGQFNDHSGAGPLDHELDYHIVGADVGIHFDDRLRVQFEYALRSSDRIVALPGKLVSDEEVSGFSVLGELRVCSSPRIGLVARYDTLSRSGDLPPPGSSLADGDFTVQRFTWGFAVTLPGGSLVLIDHEHWFMPHELGDVDTLGLRWVVTF